MLTVTDILYATKGTLMRGEHARTFSGVSTDSRGILPGELFVALKGKNFNGHDFIKDVIRRKAGGVLVSRCDLKVPASIPVIFVRDTLRAYGLIAKYYRQRFEIPVIAITGSTGKTTTKEMIAAVLQRRYRILKSSGGDNNQVGVPKTLLGLRAEHEIAVVEFGTNHFGEIHWLTEIARPTIAVMTNIGFSHIGFFKSLGGVFKEKKNIYRDLKKGDAIIFNADDAYLARIFKERTPAKRLAFGIRRKVAVRAEKITRDGGGLSLSFSVRGQRFCLKTLSRANVYNALAAIAVGRLLHAQTADIQAGLQAVDLPRGRQNVLKAGGAWIIDDTYNANPTSVAVALEALADFPSKGKKIFVFGDMFELGVFAKKAHEEVGRQVRKYAIDHLITVGRSSPRALKAIDPKVTKGSSCQNQAQACRVLRALIRPGDVVLVKGSRSMHMENIVAMLRQAL